MNVEFRRLEARDLDVVEAIERESYPTPWSRSMFDAELRKPSGWRSARSSTTARSSDTRSSHATWTHGT